MTTTRFGDAWESPGFLLWHATLRWQRAMRAALDPHGLTHVQFVLLASCWWLTDHGGPPTQRQLADHAGTDAMMTSQVVRALADNGLVTRTRDAADGRVWRVRLTSAGSKRLRSALPDVEQADVDYFAAASTPDVVATLKSLIG